MPNVQNLILIKPQDPVANLEETEENARLHHEHINGKMDTGKPQDKWPRFFVR